MMVIVTCDNIFSILFQFWDFINFIVFITGAQYSLFYRFLYLITRLNFTCLINLCRKSFVQLLITKFYFPAGSIPNQAEVKNSEMRLFLKITSCRHFFITMVHSQEVLKGGKGSEQLSIVQARKLVFIICWIWFYINQLWLNCFEKVKTLDMLVNMLLSVFYIKKSWMNSCYWL